MRSTVALSITLPHKMAAMVRNKVKSGEYASESEVIREGLRALMERDKAIEEWRRTEFRKSVAETLSSTKKRQAAVEQSNIKRVPVNRRR
jgi:putative addiction module CopG family antidote